MFKVVLCADFFYIQDYILKIDFQKWNYKSKNMAIKNA